MHCAKKMMIAGASALAVLATALAAPSVASASNLLVNGSFEDLGGAVPEGWGGYTYYAGALQQLPGWTVDFGSVDVTTNASSWSPASNGSNSLDINGWNAGQISQGFDDVAGRLYKVSFDYSRNAAGAPDPATADVVAGGQSAHVSSPHNTTLFGTPNHMLWQSRSFTFVGTGHDSIRLTATIPGNGGVFFDNVSVAGVPEPAAWALMVGGFGLIGGALRRRRGECLTA
jgi:hypothetical protein